MTLKASAVDVDSARVTPAEVASLYALYTDWASYTDRPEHQDPEVAFEAGYLDVPLPPGALSVLGLIDSAILDDCVSPCNSRSWRASSVVTAEMCLEVAISRPPEGPGLTARFTDERGVEVLKEEFTTEVSVLTRDSAHKLGEAPQFATGPLDQTRLNAMCFALGSLSTNPPRWGGQADNLEQAAGRLVLPALVAARTCVTTADATGEINAVDVVAADDHSAHIGQPWFAFAGGWREHRRVVRIVSADGGDVAQVLVSRQNA